MASRSVPSTPSLRHAQARNQERLASGCAGGPSLHKKKSLLRDGPERRNGDAFVLRCSFFTFSDFAKTTFCQKQAHSHKRQSTSPIIHVRSFRSFTAGACRANSGQRSPLYYVLPTEPSPSSAALGEHWQAVVRANVGAARQPLVDAPGVEDVAACVSKEASKA